MLFKKLSKIKSSSRVNKTAQRLGWTVKRLYSHGACQNLFLVRALHIPQRRACTLPTRVYPWDLAFAWCISIWLIKSTGKPVLLSSQRSFWQAPIPQSIYNFPITSSGSSEPEVQQGAWVRIRKLKKKDQSSQAAVYNASASLKEKEQRKPLRPSRFIQMGTGMEEHQTGHWDTPMFSKHGPSSLSWRNNSNISLLTVK